MKRKWLLILPLTALAAVLYWVVLPPPSKETPRVSVSVLRARMEAALPPGTPRSQVEAWLASEELGWSDITKVGTNQRIGLGGRIRDIYRSGYGKGTEIRFDVYFDEQDKLVSLTVEQINLSL